MAFDTTNRQDFESLLAIVGTEAFDVAAKQQLNAWLAESEEARQLYLAHCQLHAMLTSTSGLLAEIAKPDVATDDTQNRSRTTDVEDNRSWRRRLKWIAVAIALAASVLLCVSLFTQHDSTDSQPLVDRTLPMGEPVGVFIRGAKAEFRQPPKFALPDGHQASPARTGHYNLAGGLVELAFPSGAELVICGPATFELLSGSRVRLEHGRISARMTTEESKGFVIETPSAIATDLGTEFAVEVRADPNAEDEFHVFNGEVSLQPRFNGKQEREKQEPVQMLTGDALRLDHATQTPAGIDLDATRFVRRLDPPVSRYGERLLELEPDVYLPMQIDGNGTYLQDAVNVHRRAKINSKSSDFVHWGAGVGEGTAFLLNGNRSCTYATLANYPQTQNGQLTVTAWVYANSRPKWASIAKNWGVGIGSRGQFHFGLFANQGGLEAHINDVDGTERTAKEKRPLPLGEWHHVAMVADGSVLRLYRNGHKVAEVAYEGIDPNPRNKTLSIGAKLNDSQQQPALFNRGFWDGGIDDLAIFNRSLDAKQIEELYEIGRGRSHSNE